MVCSRNPLNIKVSIFEFALLQGVSKKMPPVKMAANTEALSA
jgi:hypothetical protein